MIQMNHHGLSGEPLRLVKVVPMKWSGLTAGDIISSTWVDQVVINPALWMDDNETVHRCYYCPLCRSHLFGSSIEDFNHRCNHGDRYSD